MTDKDIVSIIKKDIVNGHTGNFLTLEVIDRSKNSMKIFFRRKPGRYGMHIV